MNGKIVLVTGATSGIGLASVRAIAALGAHVVVGGRDAARVAGVVAETRSAGGAASPLAFDIASFAAVRAAAKTFGQQHGRLDVLVNNAGVVLRKRQTSVDGHELTWATNVLGLALLTRSLLPLLRAAPEPRVVNVSSEAHKYGRIAWDDVELERARYTGIRAYAQSKLAVNLYTRELARREPHVAANAVHPGAIATDIWRSLPFLLRALLARTLPPAERGAVPVVRLATGDDVRGRSGRYFDKLVETEPSPRSRDDAAAARLWDLLETTFSSEER